MAILDHLPATPVLAETEDSSLYEYVQPGATSDSEDVSDYDYSTGIDYSALEDAVMAPGGAFDVGNVGTIIDIWGSINTEDENTPRQQEFSLGTASRPWGAIYAEEGVITTSDRNAKSLIADSSLGLRFLMNLRPVSYVLRNNPSNATAYGFIGQEVEVALKGRSFEGLRKSESGYALRYSDFIAPIVRAVQQQQAKIDSLEEQLVALRKELSLLKG